ncbi:hypothetical protein MMC30_007551 [Trapelia coarctata]|nr:hypothetical protein [Trapelia coarctata]
MALWPFGRKKRKTNKRDGPDMSVSKEMARDNPGTDPGRTMTTTANSFKGARRPSRRTSQRRTRSKPRVLTKSQSSSTHDLSHDLEKFPSVPPVPTVPRPIANASAQYNEKAPPALQAGPSRLPLTEIPSNREDIPSYYFQNPMLQSSIQPEKFNVEDSVPTLRTRRSARDSTLPRGKSSKRKKEDNDREREIRALSNPIPIPKRPQSNPGGLLARESKRIPGGLNRNFERPTSEISLPVADSLHSSRSEVPDAHAFKISAFDVLSPRPTIKYAENPRWTAGGSSLGPSRTSTRKEKRPSVPDEEYNSRQRIDDLADELDVGDLRELMERDRRRKEKKRKTDHDKLQQRLQRKSEKQRAEGIGDQTSPGEGVQSEGDALGVGLGESSRSQPDNQNVEPKSPEPWLEDASGDNSALENPFNDPMSETRREPPTPDERDEPAIETPVIETATAIRLSTTSMSPPTSPTQGHARGPSNLSTLNDLASRSTPDVQEGLKPESARRGSDTSSRLASSWTSFFRRSGTRGTNRTSAERGRTTPSEFSNTSRDSLSRKAVPPPPSVPNVRHRSGTPVRTQSKFREDLPELPISPPMSRVQSPEIPGRASPYIDHASKLENLTGDPIADKRLSDVHPAYRDEVVMSRGQSPHGPSPEIPSEAILSQSLASVDSEGSWLSGRPTKRSSQQMNPMRSSGGSLSQHVQEIGSPEESRGGTEGTSFTRHTPSPRKLYAPGVLSSQLNSRGEPPAEESGDEEASPPQDEDVKMNEVIGRTPTIVRRSLRAKSREGLLSEYQNLDDSPGSSPAAYSPEALSSEFGDAPAAGSSIHRATSVDLGKSGHVRHISAGSARLLNLPPRSSGEIKRLSLASGEKSPLGNPLGASDETPDVRT